jgi:hypothetical protein
MCIAPGETRRPGQEVAPTTDAVEFATCAASKYQLHYSHAWIQPHSRLADYQCALSLGSTRSYAH